MNNTFFSRKLKLIYFSWSNRVEFFGDGTQTLNSSVWDGHFVWYTCVSAHGCCRSCSISSFLSLLLGCIQFLDGIFYLYYSPHGLSAIYLRCVNSFFRWLDHLPSKGGSPSLFSLDRSAMQRPRYIPSDCHSVMIFLLSCIWANLQARLTRSLTGFETLWTAHTTCHYVYTDRLMTLSCDIVCTTIVTQVLLYLFWFSSGHTTCANLMVNAVGDTVHVT